MILRTELTKVVICRDDAKFNMVDVSTSELTEIALKNRGETGQKLKMTFVKATESWENVVDGKGVQIECNDENKSKIFEANSKFMESLLAEYHEKIEKNESDQKKISKPGQNGT